MDPATIDRIDRIFKPAEARHHDSNRLRRLETDMLQQLNARLTGKLLIGQDNIDGPLSKDFTSCFGRRDPQNLEIAAKELGEKIANSRFIIDYKN